MSLDLTLAAASELVRAAVAAGRPALNEWEAKSVLAAYGVPVPAGSLARSENEALVAAERLGGRLAMKAVGSAITHKTESRLVILDVSGAESVAETYRLLAKRAGAACEGVLIEKMASSDRELLVGMKRDPVFGPVVVFGLGGILAEVLADVALAVVPLDERDLSELPDLIRARRILGAVRGLPAVDREALAAVIRALARIAIDLPEITEIDVNPLLIEGKMPVAADALCILAAGTGAGGAAADRGQAQEVIPRSFPLDLSAVFTPSSVAVIGASSDIRKWGGSVVRNLLDGGYAGTIYPVSPRGDEVFGLSTYASIAEVPEPPDLALLAIGGRQVGAAIEECGRRGVRAAIVLAAGFSETGAEGASLERELAALAGRYRMTLVGPNCIGLISNAASFHATGFVTLHPSPGHLSFVTQSGSLTAAAVFTCERQNVGLEKVISVGNEAQVTAADVLDYLRDDPHTKGITMYLEGIENGRHFLEAARRTTPSKPVVVLKGGLTETGGRAAASHTGALAGSSAVYEAAARQAGVVTCRSVSEMVEIGACLTYLPPPRGRRVAIVTNGGGPGVMAADEAVLNGLQLAEVPEETLVALDRLLPPFWSRRNPLDLVASAYGDLGLQVMDLVARCDAVDAIVAFGFVAVPSVLDEGRRKLACGELDGFSAWELSWLERIASLMEETGKPVIPVPAGPIHVAGLEQVQGRYRPVLLPSAGAAMRALERMCWYGEYVAAATAAARAGGR